MVWCNSVRAGAVAFVRGPPRLSLLEARHSPNPSKIRSSTPAAEGAGSHRRSAAAILKHDVGVIDRGPLGGCLWCTTLLAVRCVTHDATRKCSRAARSVSAMCASKSAIMASTLACAACRCCCWRGVMIITSPASASTVPGRGWSVCTGSALVICSTIGAPPLRTRPTANGYGPVGGGWGRRH